MKILHLSLKTKWYRMIESGEKTEEYREITPYWTSRLVDIEKFESYTHIPYRYYDVVEFTLGYPKKEDTDRRMTFKVIGIEQAMGNPIWGAPTDRCVYIIRLGSRIL